MGEARINIRTEEELKSAAEKLFEQMGMNLTTAVNVFLRQSVREGALPFRPSAVNPETIEALKDIESGNVTEYESVDSWIASH